MGEKMKHDELSELKHELDLIASALEADSNYSDPQDLRVAMSSAAQSLAALSKKLSA